MKNTKAIFIVIIFLFSFAFFSNVPLASADDLWKKQIGMGTQDGVGGAFGETVSSRDDVQDLRLVISKYINIFLGFLGIVFLILIIYAGILWLSAQGNSDNVSKARSLLFTGIIGLAVILSAFAIASFVTDRLFMATQNNSSQTNTQ